jgi:hypothetical protein
MVRCELVTVSRAMASRLRSAARARYAVAVSPIRLMRAARAASSLDRNACSLASDRLRRRPNRSISQVASPTCAEYWAAVTVALSDVPTRARAAATPAIASIDGSCWPRWIRYCARAASTLSAARRRSRFCASACATTWRSRGSRTNSCHGRLAAVALPAPPAKRAGTGAAGRS